MPALIIHVEIRLRRCPDGGQITLQVLGDFTLYDYNEPLEVPEALHGAFEVVVADPPYLVKPSTVLTAAAAF